MEEGRSQISVEEVCICVAPQARCGSSARICESGVFGENEPVEAISESIVALSPDENRDVDILRSSEFIDCNVDAPDGQCAGLSAGINLRSGCVQCGDESSAVLL